MNLNNIYSTLKLPFSNTKNKLVDRMSNDVDAIVQVLKNQNLSKEELIALKACYETAYQDSIESLGVIVVLFTFFASMDIVSNFSFFEEICLIVKFILLLFWLLYTYYKIKRLNKENISLRNYIMAVSILIAEYK